jgi:hypothetical protein
MITRTYYYTEESTDPFYNLAIEQHLLDICRKAAVFYTCGRINTP